MKFKGQVKIPELDSPGVPAVILIEDPQAELIVEGESLGRWSLADVRAERLIASAFSLDLDGDEVTFIADDPINFAYGGVDEMAKVWARYKTMTMPRRIVATSRSRKGTKPSRIGDLRSAIEETLSGPPPAPTQAQRDPVVAPAPVAPPPVVAEPVPEAVPPAVDSESPSQPVNESAPEAAPPAVDSESPFQPADQSESSPTVAEEVPAATIADDEEFRPPPPPTALRPPDQESVYKDAVPWAEQPQATEAVPAAGETDGEVESEQAVPEAAPRLDESPFAASVAVPDAEQPGGPTESDPDSEPDSEAEEQGSAGSADPSVPWLEPAPAEPPMPPRHVEPAATVENPPPTAPERPQYVVDLGAFEQNDELAARAKPAQHDDPEEVALEPAMAGVEKGGIMGAVRSAFVRNRDVHDHEYVAAPGGIGIVRNICTHCGHISIGVSE